MERVRISSGFGFALWCIGWLFTIGYLKLAFWPGALALLLWPYEIGVALQSLHP
ncbi:MAG: hypothetical protein KGJ78_02635 [Alphaproteobacteria bacterium]|nr:hypothetical protein [Alphaproteobacteria bacterium]